MGHRTGLLEPERNDPCPCFSGRKFKKCCASRYRDLPTPSGWGSAFANGDLTKALTLLRAETCRYVIWYRSHTAPMLASNSDAAEWILTVDVRALGDYLDSLRTCYHAAGIGCEFPTVLDRAAELIPDRRWEHQILLQRVLVALGPSWNREKGREALGDLDIDDVDDPELLTVFMDVQRDNLSTPETLRLCDRVIAEADDPSYRLHYAVLKAILWIFLGEADAAVSMLRDMLHQTDGAREFDRGWGQQALIGALYLAGSHGHDSGLLHRARAVCESALKADSWKPEGRAYLHEALGDIAVALDDLDEAIRQYATSADLAPTASARISLGRCYVAAGRSGDASALFEAVAAMDLDEGVRVDLVLARCGLLLAPHDEPLRTELRAALERLQPRYPIHREIRDGFLRHISSVPSQESGVLERLRRLWRRLPSFIILQPTFFGVGVDLKAMGDFALGDGAREHRRIEAVVDQDRDGGNG